MAKEVELRNPIARMLKGLDTVADTVSGTLGPRGRNAFIDEFVPIISNDGKRIAESITLEDKVENLGAWTVKNTASQTNDDAGDGTTTTVVLLQEIIHEALKRPENAMEVSHSLSEASKGVLKAIKSKSRPVKDVYQVALTSTEDEELASVITKVVEKVGDKGTILIEENNLPKIDFETVDGYEANVGYYSPYFVTDQKRMVAEFKNVAVFVTEKKIAALGDIETLFTLLKEQKITQLVIVCEDIDQTMLGILIQNKLMGRFSGLVVKANGPLLQDISSMVGATIISDSTGVRFEDVTLDHLGNAQKVFSSEKKTVFLSNSPTAKQHADMLESSAKSNPNKWEAKKAMERVAKLRGGMAVIRVGASTSIATGYLKDKAEDAVHATQAALEEGIVEGGGMTLWRVAQEMKPKTIGEEILKKALTKPLKKICENAGVDYTEMVSKLPEGKGYDAKTEMAVDMFERGIVDPAKVERAAVTNAISNAAKFITTHVTITELEEKK